MKTIQVTIYEYKELSPKAKEKALTHYQNNNTHDMLSEDMGMKLRELLSENKIDEIFELDLLYSLGHSQGDGVCFTGTFQWENRFFVVKHSGHYYHNRSVDIDIEARESERRCFGIDADPLQDTETQDEKILSQFKELYESICDKVEEFGYDCIEQEDSEESFIDFCDNNEIYFTEDGERA